MASVFKRKRDRKRRNACWYIAYFDVKQGKRRTVKGCPDKVATEAMARKLESEAELRKRGIFDPRVDTYAAHEARPLAEHLDDWHTFLAGKGSTRQHALLSKNRVARVAEVSRIDRLSQIVPSRIQAALVAIRDEGRSNRSQKSDDAGQPTRSEPLSLRSLHHYTRAVKGFSRWLWRDGRVPADALAHLTSPNPETDRRRVRRALSEEEVGKLLRAAESAGVVYKLTGPDRAMLYRMALATGFRANELRSLTPESFDLQADCPAVIVAAAYSKHRREDRQPLPSSLLPMLASWIAGKPQGQPLWGRLTKHTADMLRKDLEAAGVPYIDVDGRVADFHAHRGTYISNVVDTGASVKTSQDLARHGSASLTIGLYAKAALHNLVGAVEALPDLSGNLPRQEPAKLAATGTAGSALTAHGQRGADGEGRFPADVDADALPGAILSLDRKPPSEEDLDVSCRVLAATDSGGGGIRTHGQAEPVNGFQDR